MSAFAEKLATTKQHLEWLVLDERRTQGCEACRPPWV